jgi:hypothetical protein
MVGMPLVVCISQFEKPCPRGNLTYWTCLIQWMLNRHLWLKPENHLILKASWYNGHISALYFRGTRFKPLLVDQLYSLILPWLSSVSPETYWDSTLKYMSVSFKILTYLTHSHFIWGYTAFAVKECHRFKLKRSNQSTSRLHFKWKEWRNWLNNLIRHQA